MMRPPTSDGRGESDVHEYDDADIEPKRGKVDDDQHPDSRPADNVTSGSVDYASTGSEDAGERPTPGSDPAEGRPDMRLPGADQGAGYPGTGDDTTPQRLAERLENGSSSSMATGEPDVLPDVEPPETTM